MKLERLTAVLAMLVLLPQSAGAQTTPTTTAPSTGTTTTITAPSRPISPYTLSATPTLNYILRPGDAIVVTFLGLEDPPAELQLRVDGGVYIPRVGEVHAEGLTLAQLKAQLEKTLAKHLVNNRVEIGLKMMAPHYILVLGEVGKPGQVEIGDHTTLFQALSEAGGPIPGADATQVTMLRGKENLVVSLAPTTNPPEVQAGDVIYVNKGAKVSIAGEVGTPGAVSLPGSSFSVWDALLAAGGPKPSAAINRIQVVRLGAAEGEQHKTLDLSRGGSSPDASFKLANGDLITVPLQHVLLVSLGAAGKTGPLPIEGPQPLLDVLVTAGVQDKRTLSKVAIIRAKDVRASQMASTPATATPAATPAASSSPAADKSNNPYMTQAPPDASSDRSFDPGAKPSTANMDKVDKAAIKASMGRVETVDVTKSLKEGEPGKAIMVADGDVIIVNPPDTTNGAQSISQWFSIFSMLGYLTRL